MKDQLEERLKKIESTISTLEAMVDKSEPVEDSFKILGEWINSGVNYRICREDGKLCCMVQRPEDYRWSYITLGEFSVETTITLIEKLASMFEEQNK